MTPEQLAISGSESAHQTALFCWAALARPRYPELEWLHAIPNGGSRGSNQRDAMRVGAKMKAEGVKKGVSDICLPVKRGPWSGLYIEMKKRGSGKVSEEQSAFGAFVQVQGFGFVVCYTWIEARDAIEAYLNWRQ